MASDLAAASKLMFYPTQEFETYRILGLLGRIQLNYDANENIFSDNLYQELKLKCADNDINIDYVVYDYCLKTQQYDLIKKFIKINYGYKEQPNFVIADLFAGEGKWLNTFCTFITQDNYSKPCYLLANELEKNRYDKIEAHEKTNLPFEELELPKNSISLMLYNPPYGSTNGIRNVKYYLQEIINRKIISNNSYRKGIIVGVIRKDDFLYSLDLLCQHFDIFSDVIYKVNEEEYEKYKQFVFIAKIKDKPYNLDNYTQAALYKKEYENIKEIINSDPQFTLNMYNCFRRRIVSHVDCNYQNLKKCLEQIKTTKDYISKPNRVWKWVKEQSEIKDMSAEKLTIPLSPKIETLANIISSGYINGKIDKHVAVGGTKIITRTELDDDKVKTVKLSKPYLNILYSLNNEIRVKQLLGDDE